MFVVAIDARENKVILGTKEELKGKTFYVQGVNLMKYSHLPEGLTVSAKIRYRNAGGLAAIFPEKEGLRVVFQEAIDSITPGQSAVFYEGNDVVGGGIIA